ncbi:hypothetical protein [Calothrix rhizosoleniae]|uniref:hypothetical protein n=1 Tax=Calothrix rhizosoleniae TaxID=888997 RepID=UPI00135633F0|nr:hypothetical protein [Calothrix rhizosoleniae]
MNPELNNAVSIATAVRDRKITALEVTQTTLQRIASKDQELNCLSTAFPSVVG